MIQLLESNSLLEFPDCRFGDGQEYFPLRVSLGYHLQVARRYHFLDANRVRAAALDYFSKVGEFGSENYHRQGNDRICGKQIKPIPRGLKFGWTFRSCGAGKAESSFRLKFFENFHGLANLDHETPERILKFYHKIEALSVEFAFLGRSIEGDFAHRTFVCRRRRYAGDYGSYQALKFLYLCADGRDRETAVQQREPCCDEYPNSRSNAHPKIVPSYRQSVHLRAR